MVDASMYSQAIRQLLKTVQAEEGDVIRISFGSAQYDGVLLPASAEDRDILVLKLPSGYNIGLRPDASARVEKRSSEKRVLSSIPASSFSGKNLPGVSVIATGGTIGTHVDYSTGAVFMCRTPEEILGTTPELRDVVTIRSVRSPFTMASEDLQPWHWQKLAEEAEHALNDLELKGVIITHGTDTLHYSSAALAFMLPGLNKPVALVGAQRSPDRGSFDGRLNLLCAAHYAGHSPFAEVAVVMHGSSSDDFCYAHRGTKVRKMHTSERDAFQSINDRPLARISSQGEIQALATHVRKRSDNEVKADTRFENKTALLKLYPGSDPALLDYLVDNQYRGVVLEAFALGHVPTGQSGTVMTGYDKKRAWIPAVKRAVKNGVVLAVTSQCLNGRVHPNVYRNLRLLSSAGATFCSDLLPETAYVKLGCALGRSSDSREVQNMLLQNWASEYNPRLTSVELK
ncbi:Glu-tRNA(Gln) amidotransferase subunit GatD [Candidatus Micrarchaeota archaeon]|nr:Glu-tRNA(Gln) amidotransferase subunit GatD [Candidatus Micrarchaeota archaeon]